MGNADFVVIIPGVLGSTLVKDGHEVWGFNTRTVTASLLSLGRNMNVLTLPEGIGHDDPQDGVTPGRLMPTAAIIPGFWKLVDGYSELPRFLQQRLNLQRPTTERAGNLVEFAYDWRLSNQLNGQRLANRVVPELERWREETNNPAAKLVFVCHSMGGLVARWFIEVLGGSELTSKLITLGTPYRGSINMLDLLSNGYNPGLGPLRAKLGPIVRSLPSTYQLLPTYDCIDDGNGRMSSLLSNDIPNVDRHNVGEGMQFHERIQSKVGTGHQYDVFALKGIAQPTSQSARLTSSGIQPIKSYSGKDTAGDGTVPRPSSHPPEWATDTKALFYGQQHGSLQNNNDTLLQILGILTDNLGTFMGGSRVGLDVPDMIVHGDTLEVTVVSDDDDPTLPLSVSCIDENGTATTTVMMTSNQDGTYLAKVGELDPGAYRIVVESALPERPVDKVEGLTLVWDPLVEN